MKHLFLIIFSLVLVTGYGQDEASSKRFHFGIGVSPIINFHYSTPKTGNHVVNCLLLESNLQGQPYNFLAQYEGHSYLSLVNYLRYDLTYIGTSSSLSLNAPLEIGLSRWIVGTNQGDMQACGDSFFDSQQGFGHVSIPVYIGLNLGLGAKPGMETRKGIGISLGLESVYASIYQYTETNHSAFPELSKFWVHPSAMINFNILDRKDNFYTVVIKGSRGGVIETTLLDGANADMNSQTYSISIIRMFNF